MFCWDQERPRVVRKMPLHWALHFKKEISKKILKIIFKLNLKIKFTIEILKIRLKNTKRIIFFLTERGQFVSTVKWSRNYVRRASDFDQCPIGNIFYWLIQEFGVSPVYCILCFSDCFFFILVVISVWNNIYPANCRLLNQPRTKATWDYWWRAS